MARLTDDPPSPLELFLRDYVEARAGAWDEIEPKVYDLLVESDVLRVAFDPEALPEHPLAQLASLGSPLFDRLLSDAAGRWNSSRLYRIGLNLEPHNLESRVRRALTLPDGRVAQIQHVRAMNFPQAVFWFKAEFASDQKEEEVIRVGIDLHYCREVRQLDTLLAMDRLSDGSNLTFPEAPHEGVQAGCRVARSHILRSVTPLANARRRDWAGTIESQIARMAGYYAQLRQEATEQIARGTDPVLASARGKSRLEAIDREESIRIAELKRKSTLRVNVTLSSLMIVLQPKLLIQLLILPADRISGALEVVWDPLSDSIEAFPCPRCGHPTFGLEIDRFGFKCSQCPNSRSTRKD